jgi:hypothetical protein
MISTMKTTMVIHARAVIMENSFDLRARRSSADGGVARGVDEAGVDTAGLIQQQGW